MNNLPLMVEKFGIIRYASPILGVAVRTVRFMSCRYLVSPTRCAPDGFVSPPVPKVIALLMLYSIPVRN